MARSKTYAFAAADRKIRLDGANCLATKANTIRRRLKTIRTAAETSPSISLLKEEDELDVIFINIYLG